jgi:hypothetical protein
LELLQTKTKSASFDARLNPVSTGVSKSFNFVFD